VALYSLGDYEPAADASRKCLAADQGDDEGRHRAMFWLGRWCASLKQWDEARDWFHKLLSASDLHPDTRAATQKALDGLPQPRRGFFH
jgi:pentatricopeptide repeat protein